MTEKTNDLRGALMLRTAKQLREWKRPPSPPIEPDLQADLEELQRAGEAVAHFASKLHEAGLVALPAATNSIVQTNHSVLPMEAYPEADRLVPGAAAKLAKAHVNSIKRWVRHHRIGWITASGRYIVCKPLLLDFLQSRGRFK